MKYSGNSTSSAARRLLARLCAAGLLFAPASAGAWVKNVVGIIPKPDVKLSGELEMTFLSGYLGSSGAIYDTRPNLSQCLSLRAEIEEDFFIDGYAWFISSLHTMQSDSHRALFHEFEGAVRFGYDLHVSDDMMLETKAGLLWNPAIGYEGASMDCWGPYVAQYFQNKYIIPYWDGLWIISPSRRARIRMGVRKPFKVTEKFTVTPFVETVWMDKRRFLARYNEEPDQDVVLGGAFGTVTFGISARYKIDDNWTVYGSFSQFDIINSQARRSVRKSKDYYAKCDWPIFKLGVSYGF